MPLHIPERLETARLVLQRLRPEDAEEIFYTYASKPEATKYVAWPTHRSLEDTRAFLTMAHSWWKEGTEFAFSVRLQEHHRLIGGCGLVYSDGNMQLGYILGPLHWNKGYATELCRKLTETAKVQPGIHRVGTFVDVDNEASIRVLQKSGFIEEARLEKWLRFVNQENAAKDCILFKLPM